MNVAISTFARRGHLLAAFAVAVLLAASSGTALAQDIRVGLSMRPSSNTLQEGASELPGTPGRVAVTITRQDPIHDPTPGNSEMTDDNRTPAFAATHTLKLTATCNGEGFTGAPQTAAADNDCTFNVEAKSGSGTIADTGAIGSTGATLTFGTSGTGDNQVVDKTIELFISDTADNADWNEEKIVLTLELNDASVTEADPDGGADKTRALKATPQKLTLTIADDDPMPTLKFAPPSMQLAKGNKQTMRVGVGIGAGGRGPLPTAAAGSDSIRGKLFSLDGESAGRAGSSDYILLSVSPPEAVGSLIKIYKDATMVDQDRGTDLDVNREGLYVVGSIGGANGAVSNENTESMTEGIGLTIEAIDVSGFRDEQITFTVMDGRTDVQKMADGGGIDDADPATVTILSAEETPTVTFSTEAIDIDEGDSETVHLLADTDQGSEVGSATVRVTGDALISLSQGGSRISGGTVPFGGSANAELTITALMDRELEDGEEKTATVTITDASGASIGDPRAVTVTVVGATAVPALPLIGQLLLGLFLMAGGSRLYRRRQK